jgi:hypothetical protein
MSKLAKALTAVAAAAGNAGGAGGAGEPDPNFNQVSLLLNGDGTDGGQNNTYTDSSSSGHTITPAGTIEQGSVSPFGDNWANYFGAGEKIYTGQSSGLAFGTGDFTIETWVYRQADIKSYSRIWHFGPYWNNNDAIALNFDDGAFPNKIAFGCYRLSTGRLLVSTTSVVSGQWYHVAVTRESGTFKLWIDGVLEDTDTTAGATEASSTNLICVASTYNRDVEEDFNGFISNLRVVKGTAVYTAAFTPPTEPLTAISGTQFLACQSNRFVDNSTNALAFTIAGTPEVTSFNPFTNSAPITLAANGGSGYFDGTGDYLTGAANPVFAFGTGDFTIESWVYITATKSPGQGIFDTRNSGPSSTGIVFLINPSNALAVYIGGVILTSSASLSLNTWAHVACVKSSGTITIYIDGINRGSVSNSTNLTDSTPTVGTVVDYRNTGSTYMLQGYISNLRIVKGTAVYTSAFTPPTAPLTAITNTSLLLNFEDAAIFDYAAVNNVNTIGSADISTSVFKYGTGSLAFDGTSDYLETPNKPELVLAGAPWTVECWVRPDGNYSSYNTIFAKRVSGSTTTSYEGFLNITTGVVSFYNGTIYSSSTTLTSDVWSHCAWVYDGTNINIYVNGVSVLSTAVTISEVDTAFVIGGARGYSEWFYGYIDDFRITKGLARYTSAFTPPTAALPTF